MAAASFDRFSVDHSFYASGRSYDVSLGGEDSSMVTKAAVGFVAAVSICQCEIIWRIVSAILITLGAIFVVTSIILACVVNPLFALGVIPGIAMAVWGLVQCNTCPEISVT